MHGVTDKEKMKCSRCFHSEAFQAVLCIFVLSFLFMDAVRPAERDQRVLLGTVDPPVKGSSAAPDGESMPQR
jgi:hypothetical protein